MKKLILIVVLMPLMAAAYETWTDPSAEDDLQHTQKLFKKCLCL